MCYRGRATAFRPSGRTRTMNRISCLALCVVFAGCAARGSNQTGSKAQTAPAQAAPPAKGTVLSKPPPPAPKDKLENAPLKWMPREAATSSQVVLAGVSQVKLQVLPVTDA